jgi:hypothetical protein
MDMQNNTLKNLQKLLPQLQADDLNHVLAFAQYLHDKTAQQPMIHPLQTPQDIQRPKQESVIGAVKRLAQTYPMLDKSKMLNHTSLLVTQHLTLGRERVVVIDELELIFAQHYAHYKQQKGCSS